MDPLIPGEEELRQRLEAFADERLRPDPLATARTRERVMAAARDVAAERGAAAARGARTALPAAMPTITRRAAPSRRRWLVGLLAAGLALGVLAGGVAAGSAPGGPFYDLRLWVEKVTLPAGRSERATAELQRIEARFAEIRAAATSGDQAALAAALAAYRAVVNETVDALPAEAREAHLEAMLAKHLDVLGDLLGTAPSQALAGLQNAIENSSKALERLGEGTPSPSPKPSNPPAASAKPSNGPAASPKPSKEPAASPKPSNQPAASPKASEQPAASPPGAGKPSPKPDASPAPEGQTKSKSSDR